ncbi:MAG: hypothetical protein J6B02_01455 [Selenomonadales bacterium]|nr:hypothetical protein [Selenomonadales bacterium]
MIVDVYGGLGDCDGRGGLGGLGGRGGWLFIGGLGGLDGLLGGFCCGGRGGFCWGGFGFCAGGRVSVSGVSFRIGSSLYISLTSSVSRYAVETEKIPKKRLPELLFGQS